MAKYLIDESTLGNMADELRIMSGISDKLSTNDMISILKESNELIKIFASSLFNITEIEYIEGTLESLKGNFEKIKSYAFYNYEYLKMVDISCNIILPCAFQNCKNLHTVKISNSINSDGEGYKIGGASFQYCTSLTSLILNSDSLYELEYDNALDGTPIASPNYVLSGYIYVPRVLMKDYQSKWSRFITRFRAIEDYPEICGGD